MKVSDQWVALHMECLKRGWVGERERRDTLSCTHYHSCLHLIRRPWEELGHSTPTPHQSLHKTRRLSGQPSVCVHHIYSVYTFHGVDHGLYVIDGPISIHVHVGGVVGREWDTAERTSLVQVENTHPLRGNKTPDFSTTVVPLGGRFTSAE